MLRAEAQPQPKGTNGARHLRPPPLRLSAPNPLTANPECHLPLRDRRSACYPQRMASAHPLPRIPTTPPCHPEQRHVRNAAQRIFANGSGAPASSRPATPPAPQPQPPPARSNDRQRPPFRSLIVPMPPNSRVQINQQTDCRSDANQPQNEIIFRIQSTSVSATPKQSKRGEPAPAPAFVAYVGRYTPINCATFSRW